MEDTILNEDVVSTLFPLRENVCCLLNRMSLEAFQHCNPGLSAGFWRGRVFCPIILYKKLQFLLRVGLVASITNGHLLFGLYGNFVGDINVGDDIISNCFPIFCFGQPLFHFSLQQSV